MIIDKKLRKKLWKMALKIASHSDRANYAVDDLIAAHEKIFGFRPTSEKTLKLKRRTGL